MTLLRGSGSGSCILSPPVTIVLVQLLTCSPLRERSVCSQLSALPLTCCPAGHPSLGAAAKPRPLTSRFFSLHSPTCSTPSVLCATVLIIIITFLLSPLPAPVLPAHLFPSGHRSSLVLWCGNPPEDYCTCLGTSSLYLHISQLHLFQ